MTMLEKIARAIAKSQTGCGDDVQWVHLFWENYIPEARAALQALLEESVPLFDGKTLNILSWDSEVILTQNQAKAALRAMIQAALDGK